MKIKKESEPVTPIEQEPTTEPLPIPASPKASYDPESSTASFKLLNGIEVAMRPPKAKQLLLAQSWYQSVDADYKSGVMTALKLAQLCIVRFGDRQQVTLDELLDSLDEENFKEDVERIAEALNYFRDRLDRFQQQSALADRPGA